VDKHSSFSASHGWWMLRNSLITPAIAAAHPVISTESSDVPQITSATTIEAPQLTPFRKSADGLASACTHLCTKHQH
jgi:hypothetical protein